MKKIVVIGICLLFAVAIVGTTMAEDGKTVSKEIKELIEEKEKAEIKEQQKRKYEWGAKDIVIQSTGTWEDEKIRTEFYDAKFLIKKPKLEELIFNGKEYFRFLEENFGEKGRLMVKETIKSWKEWLDSQGETIEINGSIVTLKLKNPNANTIAFDKYLYKWWFGWQKSDPVNLIFYKEGSAWDVQYDMKNWIDNKWNDTSGIDLYTWIDKDHADGEDWVWKTQDYQLGHGDFFGKRYHIRIYDGGYDWDAFEEWSIAGVHYEEWIGYTHKILSWEQAESFVKNDFDDEWFVGSIWYAFLDNDETLQGQYNDGYAPVIELLY